MSSSAEIMMTGTWRSSLSACMCASTSKPSISGMTTSSRTTSKDSARRISNARRPSSAVANRCPSRSRLRESSKRLTESSSTTSTYAPAGATSGPASQGSECAFDAGVLFLDPCDEVARTYEGPRVSTELELFAQRGKCGCAERPPVRLQRVSGPAQLFGVALLERASERPNETGSIVQECRNQLADEDRIANSCLDLRQVNWFGIDYFLRRRRGVCRDAEWLGAGEMSGGFGAGTRFAPGPPPQCRETGRRVLLHCVGGHGD